MVVELVFATVLISALDGHLYIYFLAYSINLVNYPFEIFLYSSLHIVLITISNAQYMIAPCRALFVAQLMIKSTSCCQFPMFLVNPGHVSILHHNFLVIRHSKKK